MILSPDELNITLLTYIVAPLTTGKYSYPSRIPCSFQNKSGHIILDQIRVIDKSRLSKYLGKIDNDILEKCLLILQ